MFGKILSAGTLISTLALLSSVIIQIYGRFFMESAPSWTEEAARVFFIYTMSFGVWHCETRNMYNWIFFSMP